MSNKIKGLIVTFEDDFSEEYADKVKAAIEIIDGVASVKVRDHSFDDTMARERYKSDFRVKFNKFITEQLYSK